MMINDASSKECGMNLFLLCKQSVHHFVAEANDIGRAGG